MAGLKVNLSDALKGVQGTYVPSSGMATALAEYERIGGRGSPYGALETVRKSAGGSATAREIGGDFSSFFGNFKSWLTDPDAYKAKLREEKKLSDEARKRSVTKTELQLMTQRPMAMFVNAVDYKAAVMTGIFQLLQVQTRYQVALAKNLGVKAQDVLQPVLDPKKSFLGGILSAIGKDLKKIPGVTPLVATGKHMKNFLSFINPFTMGSRLATNLRSAGDWFQKFFLGEKYYNYVKDPKRAMKDAGLHLEDTEKLVNLSKVQANFLKEQTQIQYNIMRGIFTLNQRFGVSLKAEKLDLDFDEYSGDLKTTKQKEKEQMLRIQQLQSTYAAASRKGIVGKIGGMAHGAKQLLTFGSKILNPFIPLEDTSDVFANRGRKGFLNTANYVFSGKLAKNVTRRLLGEDLSRSLGIGRVTQRDRIALKMLYMSDLLGNFNDAPLKSILSRMRMEDFDDVNSRLLSAFAKRISHIIDNGTSGDTTSEAKQTSGREMQEAYSKFYEQSEYLRNAEWSEGLSRGLANVFQNVTGQTIYDRSGQRDLLRNMEKYSGNLAYAKILRGQGTVELSEDVRFDSLGRSLLRRISPISAVDQMMNRNVRTDEYRQSMGRFFQSKTDSNNAFLDINNDASLFGVNVTGKINDINYIWVRLVENVGPLPITVTGDVADAVSDIKDVKESEEKRAREANDESINSKEFREKLEREAEERRRANQDNRGQIGKFFSKLFMTKEKAELRENAANKTGLLGKLGIGAEENLKGMASGLLTGLSSLAKGLPAAGLFGGMMLTLFGTDTGQEIIKRVKKYIFGDENTGEPSLWDTMIDKAKDFFFGKGEDDPDSPYNKIKKTFGEIWDWSKRKFISMAEKSWDYAKENPLDFGVIAGTALLTLFPGYAGKFLVGGAVQIGKTLISNPITFMYAVAGMGTIYNIVESWKKNETEGGSFGDFITRLLFDNKKTIAGKIGKISTWAFLGATAGSVVPGIGTLCGFIGGAIIGWLVDSLIDKPITSFSDLLKGVVGQREHQKAEKAAEKKADDQIEKNFAAQKAAREKELNQGGMEVAYNKGFLWDDKIKITQRDYAEYQKLKTEEEKLKFVQKKKQEQEDQEYLEKNAVYMVRDGIFNVEAHKKYVDAMNYGGGDIVMQEYLKHPEKYPDNPYLKKARQDKDAAIKAASEAGYNREQQEHKDRAARVAQQAKKDETTGKKRDGSLLNIITSPLTAIPKIAIGDGNAPENKETGSPEEPAPVQRPAGGLPFVFNAASEAAVRSGKPYTPSIKDIYSVASENSSAPKDGVVPSQSAEGASVGNKDEGDFGDNQNNLFANYSSGRSWDRSSLYATELSKYVKREYSNGGRGDHVVRGTYAEYKDLPPGFVQKHIKSFKWAYEQKQKGFKDAADGNGDYEIDSIKNPSLGKNDPRFALGNQFNKLDLMWGAAIYEQHMKHEEAMKNGGASAQAAQRAVQDSQPKQEQTAEVQGGAATIAKIMNETKERLNKSAEVADEEKKKRQKDFLTNMTMYYKSCADKNQVKNDSELRDIMITHGFGNMMASDDSKKFRKSFDFIPFSPEEVKKKGMLSAVPGTPEQKKLWEAELDKMIAENAEKAKTTGKNAPDTSKEALGQTPGDAAHDGGNKKDDSQQQQQQDQRASNDNSGGNAAGGGGGGTAGMNDGGTQAGGSKLNWIEKLIANVVRGGIIATQAIGGAASAIGGFFGGGSGGGGYSGGVSTAGVDMNDVGALCDKFESGKNSALAGPDCGATAYGRYQFNAGQGTMVRFMEFLKRQGPEAKEVYDTLMASVGGNVQGFNLGNAKTGKPIEAWKALANAGKLQKWEMAYAMADYFDPVYKALPQDLRSTVDKTMVLKQVLFSTSINHGQPKTTRMFRSAWNKCNGNVQQFISEIYEMRRQDKPKLANRFKNESALALSMLNGGGYGGGTISGGTGTLPNGSLSNSGGIDVSHGRFREGNLYPLSTKGGKESGHFQSWAPNISEKALQNADLGGEKLVWPSKHYVITSPLGPRNAGNGASAYHGGIDVRAGVGDPIYASMSGKVVGVGGNDGIVAIQSKNGMITRYIHLSKAFVKMGQEITAGQHIGAAGRTGGGKPDRWDPHLHMDIQRNGKYIDPEAVFYRMVKFKLFQLRRNRRLC